MMTSQTNIETTVVVLDAYALVASGESVDDHELAQRFSEAIIDAVTKHKTVGWELVNMDFKGGQVDIHLRRVRNS